MRMGDRLRQIRKRRRLTQVEVAKRVGISQQTYQAWESGKHGPRWQHAQKLAEALDCRVDWLLGQMGAEGATGATDSEVVSVPAARMVPLITWEQAANWGDTQESHDLRVAEDWRPAPASVSEHSYCLRVTGDSMVNPSGRPSIPAGSIIYVDPARTTPSSGEIIIAKIVSTGKVTCKQYLEDAGQAFLRPLNPTYPTITEEFLTLGTVVGLYTDLTL